MSAPSQVVAVPSLDVLFRIHDSQPATVAKALRSMADNGIDRNDHVRFSWLVNHVIGEKERAWGAALELLNKALADSPEVGAMCHTAVAALFAGRPVRVLTLLPRIAAAADATSVVAACAVRLGALQFVEESEPTLDLAEAFNAVLEELAPATGQIGRLGAMVASSLNNVTTRLLDAKDAPVSEPSYRFALTGGAQTCRTIWSVAGTWINRERADYLMALCANKVQDFVAAKRAADSGIKTIEDNGSEDVDRAFLLIELSRAHRGLSEARESEQARAAALQLADRFDENLREWFDSRAAA